MATAVVLLVMCLGSAFTARSAGEAYPQRVAALEQQTGQTLEEALRRPANLRQQRTPGGVITTSDNPLRSLWDDTGRNITGAYPQQAIGDALEQMSMSVLPVLFFAYGALQATYGIRNRTLKCTVSRYGPLRTYVGTGTAAGVVTVLAVPAAALLSMAVYAPVWAAAVPDVPRLVPPAPVPWWHLVLIAAAATCFCLFYLLVGLAVGSAAGSTLAIVPICAVVVLMVPYGGAWDPRSLILRVAVAAFPGFSDRVTTRVIGLAPAWAVALCVLFGAGFLAAGWGLWRLRNFTRA